MADNKEKQKGYFPTVAATAPVFAVKALVGDLPKGAIEYGVQKKLMGGKKSFFRYTYGGLRGPAAGRAIGGVAGILTAPLFLKGTELMQSDDKKGKARGAAYIAASTAAYAGSKGFLEKFLGARAEGLSPLSAAAKGALLGAVRSSYKLPIALATAAAVAAGRRKKDNEEKPSAARKFITPMLVGMGSGAASRALEEAVDMSAFSRGRVSPFTRKGIRRVSAAAGGGAAGGLLGGLVLAGAVDAANKLMEGKEKKAAIPLDLLADLGAQALPALKRVGLGLSHVPAALGLAADDAIVGTLSIALNNPAVRKGLSTGASIAKGSSGIFAQHAGTGAAFGYGPAHKLINALPGGRRMSAALQRVGNRTRARQVAIGIKEGLKGYADEGFGNRVLHAFTVPEIAASRQSGIQLGRALRKYHPQDREKILRGIQGAIIDNKAVLRGPDGEVNPLIGPLFSGISMAMGSRPMDTRKAGLLTKAYKTLLHTGRIETGSKARGLPTDLGELRKEKTYLQKLPGHIATGILAAPLTLAGGLPASLGWHGVVSAVKGAVADTKGFHGMTNRLAQEAAQGKVFGGKRGAGSAALELLLSPATTMSERSIAPVAGVIRDKALARVAQGAENLRGKATDRLLRPKRASTLKTVGTGVGIGAGAGTVGVLGSNLWRGKNREK